MTAPSLDLEVCSTAGELVQVCANDLDVHITAPINVFNRYSLTATRGSRTLGQKAHAAATRCLALSHSELQPTPLFVKREGVVGAGMGTSTADTIAAALTHAKLTGLDLQRHQLIRLVSSVERSDGIFHDGVCLVQQGPGRLLKRLPAPNWRLVLLVPRMRLATECARPYRKRFRNAYVDILSTVCADVSDGDLIDCINLSASINAAARDYEFYFDVRRRARALGADGVGIAHTGSLVFLVYRDSEAFAGLEPRLLRALRSRYRLDRLICAEFALKSWRWMPCASA